MESLKEFRHLTMRQIRFMQRKRKEYAELEKQQRAANERAQAKLKR